MCSLRESIFDVSAPLAVFNSSICSQMPLNDSNNNICEKVYIDEFSDEDILWIYKKNPKQETLTQTLEIELKARFRWKKILIIVLFVRSLQLRVKSRLPVITITSTSPPNFPKLVQDMNLYETPVQKRSKRFTSGLVPEYKPNKSVVNFEGSFLIYQSIGSSSSYIKTPNMRLFNIDLQTPSTTGCQEGLFVAKKDQKSNKIVSNPSTLVRSKGRNLLAVGNHGVRPSYSYSSIPYIDQEELDKIMKTEYNLHVINLCRIDDEAESNFIEKPCQNCINNLFFIFKSITSSLRQYLVSSLNKEKAI